MEETRESSLREPRRNFKLPVAFQDQVEQVRQFANKEKKPFRKALSKFVAVVLAFLTLLLVLYFEQYPPKYHGSYDAISRNLDFELAEKVHDAESFWDWFSKIHEHIAGSTYHDADVYCYAPRVQTVTIGDTTFESADPNVNFTSCLDQARFVQGWDRPLALSGNHHLLTFGMFTRRAPLESVSHRLYESTDTFNTSLGTKTTAAELLVRGRAEPDVDPERDIRIIEICDADSSSICVLRDGSNGTVGSTLGWEHKEIDGYSTFYPNSSAHIHLNLKSGVQQTTPCYAYKLNNNGEYSVVPGSGNSDNIDDYSVSNCRYTWVSSAIQIRGECLQFNRTQPTTALAYGVALFKYSDIYKFISDTLLCDLLPTLSYPELANLYVKAEYPLDKHLPDERVYGTFIPTDSPPVWLGIGAVIKELLQTHSFIDANTGSVIIYMVTRDLSPNALFYTHVAIEFRFERSGNVVCETTVDYFPIVHYTYALDGYPWKERRVLILESLFLATFSVSVWILVVSTFFKIKKTWKSKYGAQVTSQNVVNDDLSLVSTTIVHEKNAEESVNAIPMIPLGARKDNRLKYSNGTNNFNNTSFQTMRSIQRLQDLSQNHNDASSEDTESGFYDTIEPNDVDISEIGRSPVRTGVAMAPSRDIGDGVENMYGIPTGRPVSELLMDWLTVASVFVFVGLRLKYISDLQDVHNFISGLPGDRFDNNLESIIEHFRELASLQGILQIVMIVTVILFIYQFFVYSAFHPRLAIVLNTIKAASYDLLPLLVIFMFIVLVYAVIATQLYGSKIEIWQSIRSSIGQLFLIILGEMGAYEDMDNFYSVETIFFYWSFIVIAFFLLYNMILAVVLSVYEQKQHAAMLEREVGHSNKKNR